MSFKKYLLCIASIVSADLVPSLCYETLISHCWRIKDFSQLCSEQVLSKHHVPILYDSRGTQRRPTTPRKARSDDTQRGTEEKKPATRTYVVRTPYSYRRRRKKSWASFIALHLLNDLCHMLSPYFSGSLHLAKGEASIAAPPWL